MTIIEMLEQYTREKPNASVLFDETHTKGITYSKLDDMSGRVYAYLKANCVGKEDFVLINLPRGILPIIAMVGIWKAGAAWALVEDTYAPERIDYIRRDCGCKLELHGGNWDEIMSVDPLAGHEQVGEHDAAPCVVRHSFVAMVHVEEVCGPFVLSVVLTAPGRGTRVSIVVSREVGHSTFLEFEVEREAADGIGCAAQSVAESWTDELCVQHLEQSGRVDGTDDLVGRIVVEVGGLDAGGLCVVADDAADFLADQDFSSHLSDGLSQ